MEILLDTHFILWTLLTPAKLSPQARTLINDPLNELVFSIASLWEIAIKRAPGESGVSG